jgi:hypothetical protein
VNTYDRVREIGDRYVQPHKYDTSSGVEIHHGLTYRQWLVGQVIAGAMASSQLQYKSIADIGEYTVKIADAIIDRLAREK